MFLLEYMQYGVLHSVMATDKLMVEALEIALAKVRSVTLIVVWGPL